jgi:acetyl esterase
MAAGRTRGDILAEVVGGAMVRGLGAIPASIADRVAGRERNLDGLQLDPHMALLLGLSDRADPADPDATAAERRARMRASTRVVAGRPLAGVRVQAQTVAGGAGPLPARLYSPGVVGLGRTPLVVWLHGGGWALGDLDTHDQPCRYLCRYGRVAVLSVDYRLAPEFPFPAAVEDALAAFSWAVDHADELGCDPSRVAIGGDSAGGNLAAVVSQLARDGRAAAPAAQLLVYPATDISVTYPSEDLFGEGYLLTRANMDWFEATYSAGAAKSDPRMSPLRHTDLSGLAPALVVTADFDPLRDEGELYARQLQAAGVPVMLRRTPGLVHGFLNMTGVHRNIRAEVIAISGSVGAMVATAQ